MIGRNDNNDRNNTLTALVSHVLVGIIQTVVVAVANVNPRYAVAVVAREQVTETRAALRLAIFGRFVRPVAAIVVAVAIPRGRYTSVVGAPEAVGRARPLRTVHRVLVAVVAAIVVAVAQPIRFHANVRLLALQMVRRARNVLRAPVVRFVRSRVVFAIVHAVAHLTVHNIYRFRAVTRGERDHLSTFPRDFRNPSTLLRFRSTTLFQST